MLGGGGHADPGGGGAASIVLTRMCEYSNRPILKGPNEYDSDP